MKKLKLIFKGILFYLTVFVTIVVICGIDDIIDKGYYHIILCDIILIITCYINILESELETFTLYKWQKKLLHDEDDE